MRWKIENTTFDAETGKLTTEVAWEDIPAEVVRGMIQSQVQEMVDGAARARGYRSGEACATYALSTNPKWKAEAKAFIAWRDDAWRRAFEMIENPPETVEIAINSIPAIGWP